MRILREYLVGQFACQRRILKQDLAKDQPAGSCKLRMKESRPCFGSLRLSLLKRQFDVIERERVTRALRVVGCDCESQRIVSCRTKSEVSQIVLLPEFGGAVLVLARTDIHAVH